MTTTGVTSFLPADEPDSINFQDSLSFFRQQLSTTTDFRVAAGGASKHAEKKFIHDTPIGEECRRISIPTVDSILESVRVLRAIQKSQMSREVNDSTSGAQERLLKTDDILNSLQPMESHENRFVENLLNNSSERSQFWPKSVAGALNGGNKENLDEDRFPCNHLKTSNNTTTLKKGAISNQFGSKISKDQTTENDRLSEPWNVPHAGHRTESVSSECPSTDNNSNLVQSEEVDETTEELTRNASKCPLNVLKDQEFNDFQTEYVPKLDETIQNETIHQEVEGETQSKYNGINAGKQSSFDLLSKCNSCESAGDPAPEYSNRVFSNQLLGGSFLEGDSQPDTEVTVCESSADHQTDRPPEQLAGEGENHAPEEEVLSRKFTTSSWDLVSIIKLLFSVQELHSPKVLTEEARLERKVFVLSKGAFSEHAEGHHTIVFKGRSLFVLDAEEVSLPLTHAETHLEERSLVVDSKVGKCLHLKCGSKEELEALREELRLCILKSQPPECIHLVHYPLKCHQNVAVIDLGSCSTRAGILMDQPTLPTLFFPSVCATNKISGEHVYGLDALDPKARQNATISFPLRPSAKIIKHSVDVDKVTGIFKKIFKDLRIDPKNYAVLVCLPRSLSISSQSAIVNVLLEDLGVKAVSLSHQAVLTMYAHNVSTGIVLDIGDRMDVLPVVDGFIVEGGVTRLPYGGQRLIHHMKHALAQKHISLSNDIDSFVVAYISEKLSYVAEDYEMEAALHPQTVRKAVDLTTFARDQSCLKSAVLDEARFKVPEGLFRPDLWGLDSPGVHQLVQKAIQAAGVDARKKVAEHIYLSGGVTLVPGFVQRLLKEVTKLNEPRITPKVHASSYRYHSTFIGACRLAAMDAFPQVCLTKEEYSKDRESSLKKFMLCP